MSARRLDTSSLNVLAWKNRKRRTRKKPFFKKKKGLMATWEDLELSSYEKDDEEVNICLIVDLTLEGEEDDEEKENDLLKKENESLEEDKTKELSTVNTLEVNEQLQEEILKYKRHLYEKFGIEYDKKKDLKKDKSISYYLNCGKFAHLSYDCKDHPKGPSKPSRTNRKGAKRIWISKKMIVPVIDLLDSRKETPIMVPDQSLAKFINGSKNLKKILKHKRHPYDKSSNDYDKKKDLKKDKSISHCLNYKKFGHLFYDYKAHPKELSKPSRTNKKGPKRSWVSKNMIVPVSYLLHNRKKTSIMVPGQWLLTSHDKRKVYVARS
ncbi:hypothetical protein CR513_44605, partial [Mucuna pruriens]